MRALVVAVGCVGLVGQAWASSNSKVPDWVSEAAHQALPEYPETTKAVVLLWDETYSVTGKGEATEHVRCVMKILRPQGRDLAYPHVWYDKDSKINAFHAWSIDPAGHEFAVKDSDIHDMASGESFELYSDERVKVADPPGRDPGGVIAYEYTQTERPYIKETSWLFQDEMPRLRQSFTLELPAGYTYSTTWAHHPSIEGGSTEKNGYRWEMNNESAIDLEHVPMSPAGESLAARMTIHYAAPGEDAAAGGTWKGIGLWYDGLAHDRLAANPAITAKAQELTAGKTEFFDKAEAIGVYLQQNIRYVAIEIGVGGFQPHPAADVFRYGYGDCKDKATLLAALLSAVGIRSTLVMVDTERGVVDPDDPSTMGNHMIAAIEVPAGYESPRMHSVVMAKSGKRYLIFDPTWNETPFGQLENNLQDSYAMLMDGNDSEVIHLPVMPPELNTIHRSASFQLSADGTLKGSVTEKRFGDVAEDRRVLAKQGDAKEQQEHMDRSVARDFGAVALTELHFDGAATLSKDMVTTFDLQAEHFASATGPLLMVRPRVFGSYGLAVDRKTRKVPIDLRETMQGNDEFDIAIPVGYAVDEMPDPVKVDWGFASYESKTEVRGQMLHYSRTFTLRAVTLPAAKYKELQDVAATIGADEENRVILKRVANGAGMATPAASSVMASN